jgi:hypothetical protein
MGILMMISSSDRMKGVNMRAIFIFFTLNLALCALTMSADAAGPWKGKIIDIETKEPLEGVVVVAVWERVYRTPAGPSSYFYEAKEVLTNNDGRYEIPAYTPINLFPIISFMRGPKFIIFKPEYLSIEVYPEENVIDKAVKLQERGKVFGLSPGLIELPRLKTMEERRTGQPSPVGDRKDWKKQRELIRALRQEWRYLYNEDPKDLYKMEK